MQTQTIFSSYGFDKSTELVPDYHSSCVKNVEIPSPLVLRQIVKPRPGDVVAVCVRDVNPAYPILELADGSEIRLSRGNIILGSIGSRKALHGFSGEIPKGLEIGKSLSLLNKGGVVGDCTAFHRNLEWPTRVEYLGTVTAGGKAVNLGDFALPFVDGPLPKTPLIQVLGTCMNSGKTTVCRTIVDGFAQRGFHINGGKVAGVACQQDLVALRKAGANHVLSFHDFGLPSSSDIESLIPVARSIYHHLAKDNPNFIILEMGDGILGGYHVSSLFADKELMGSQICTVICANDFMGAWGALEWMSQNGFSIEENSVLISGPVTDSAEGVRFIEANFGVPAANPFDSPGKLCRFVQMNLPC